MAEARSVVMPCERAAALIAASVGVASSTERRWALIGSTSKMPVRPR